ncbi:Kinesin-related protein [Gracilaria domingensis]|nr:Kinesin-related protein [Gracilaria domingensis]
MSSTLSPGGYVRQGQRGAQPARSVNVQVAVRCRPLNEREKNHGERSVLAVDSLRKEVVLTAPTMQRKGTAMPGNASGKKTYTYDHVYGISASQAEVYEGVVEPIVDEVLEGYNCTVFAYGQTGTGKTHTMEGRRDADMTEVAERRLAENAGIIPRAVKQIFDHLRSLTDEHSVRVSHLELYNEQLTDLLGPEHDSVADSLRVYEDPQKGTFVQGLEDVVVRSENEIFAVLDRSAMKRKTAETLMNKYSSRSHSIFSITIHIKQSTPEGADLLKVGKLNLVDLAGSENIGRSGAVKGRAREAGNINQSLLTLGRVITALVDRHPHIPYRDSKLTRLLQESLGGRNKTCVIATVTPGSSSIEETASTLDYAYRAKSIKNRPTVNQMIAKHVLLKEYTEEISRLKRELDATREKNGVYLPPEEYERLQALARQQKEEITALATQSEEHEQRMENLKEKLEQTQFALCRDQESLRETRQSLAETSDELTSTRETLAITEQQRDEYSFLTKSHVATESRLYQQGSQLQEDLSTCISDAGALHDRLDVMTALETENQGNLSNLKQSIAASTAEISNIVNGHTKRQIKSMGESRQNMEQATNQLKVKLSVIEEELQKLSIEWRENNDQFDAYALENEDELKENCKNHTSLVTDALSKHSADYAARKKVLDATCEKILRAISASRATVSDIKQCVIKHSAAQVAQLNRLTKDQAGALANLSSQVAESLENQSQAIEELQVSQATEFEMEATALSAFKSNLIEKLTAAADSLISETCNRIENRRAKFETITSNIRNNGNFVRNALSEMDDTQTRRLGDMQEDMKLMIHKAEGEIETLSSNHHSATETVSESVTSILEDTTGVSASLQHFTETSTSQLCKVEQSISEFRKKCVNHRQQRAESSNSVLEKNRQKTETVNKEISDDTSASVNDLLRALTSMEENVTQTASDVKEKLTSNVENRVVSQEILCDRDRAKAPKRRQWAKPVPLSYTRNHFELLAERRKASGAPEVPIDDFGHSAIIEEVQESQNQESEADYGGTESGASRRSSTSSLATRSINEEGSVPEERSVEVSKAAASEASSQKGSTGNPEVDEDAVEAVILVDATNRRASRKAKRRTERGNRKKPTGIPLPRARQTRKVGK